MEEASKPIKVTVTYVNNNGGLCKSIPIKGIKASDFIIKTSSGERLNAKKTDIDGVFTIENM